LVYGVASNGYVGGMYFAQGQLDRKGKKDVQYVFECWTSEDC
jgi:hypothetical protein